MRLSPTSRSSWAFSRATSSRPARLRASGWGRNRNRSSWMSGKRCGLALKGSENRNNRRFLISKASISAGSARCAAEMTNMRCVNLERKTKWRRSNQSELGSVAEKGKRFHYRATSARMWDRFLGYSCFLWLLINYNYDILEKNNGAPRAPSYQSFIGIFLAS